MAQTCNPSIISDTPDSRYAMNSNGTAVDKKTGLMWMRCAIGQTWESGTCTGSATGMNWQAALQTAENTSFASFSDWRLPNPKELQSIVDYRCYAPAININTFPNTSSTEFWSSSPLANSNNAAWLVNFYRGFDGNTFNTYNFFIRLVRDGQ